MKKINQILVAITLVVLSFACNKEDKAPLVLPTTYTSANYDSNVLTEKAFRSQMAALTSYMKRGENVLNKLEADSLTKYFTLNGTSPLKSITSTYYSNLIESTWFSTMVSSSQNV